MKQTIIATSSNHVELLAIHEASREWVCLRSIIQHIQQTCCLSSGKISATTIYEDNIAYITKLKEYYIKEDRTKHISPKFFFIHDLQKNGVISIQQILSCDNLANVFTKSLPSRTFNQLIQKIGLHHRRNDCSIEEEK